MTERHNDRSVVAIWFVAFVALCALGLTGRCPAEAPAQTDGSAEPMIISWTGGSLPSTSGDGETAGDAGATEEDTIQVHPTEEWHDRHRATVIAAHNDVFRHLIHESGPAGCVLTGELRTVGGAVLHSGGGRECPRGPADRRCGYIAEGYTVFALAGGSCASFGVPPCTGPFCY